MPKMYDEDQWKCVTESFSILVGEDAAIKETGDGLVKDEGTGESRRDGGGRTRPKVICRTLPASSAFSGCRPARFRRSGVVIPAVRPERSLS